jgi:hypothetical protein
MCLKCSPYKYSLLIKSMKTKFTILIALVCILFGCHKNDPTPSVTNPTTIKPVTPTPPVVTPPVATPTVAIKITSFQVNGFIEPAVVVIGDTAITLSVAPGTDISALMPTIGLSDVNASVNPKTNVAQDFTKPVTYVTTSADGKTKKNYHVSILAPSPSAKDNSSAPANLLIYYGWLSTIRYDNGPVPSIAQAIDAFGKFDVLVFGDKLELTSHQDYNNTVAIISGIKSKYPKVKIFGYVDLGVKTQNLKAVDYDAEIDAWKNLNVDGIFGDDFGGDWGVNRDRQNDFITYIHGKNMSVFANSFYVGDALGNGSKLNSNDYYLFEPTFYGNGQYIPFTNSNSKADTAYYYMKKLGVKIATVATTAPNQVNSTSNTSDQYNLAYYATRLYNFDAFQFTENYYSASTSIVYLFPQPNLNITGQAWNELNGVKKVSGQEYTRSVDGVTIHITGDGVSSGKGFVTQ